MSYQFCEYEPWMREQVIDMFCEEYGNQRSQFAEYYDRFYGGYQQGKALRLVIRDGETVAGFVSFSYWPYLADGKPLNSYQAGNVIIHKNYRGKGLYNQLLNYVNENASRHGIDLIVGFPIRQILKLYLKSDWINPFNLNWYLKPVNPLGKLFPVSERGLSRVFASEKKYRRTLSQGGLVLHIDESFYAWNRDYNNLSRHFYFEFAEGDQVVEFALKLNKRKYFNELIVGEVNTNSRDPRFLERGLRRLRRRAMKAPGISVLSICINDQNTSSATPEAIARAGFRKINRDIKFIVNPLGRPANRFTDAAAWELYRRDIDTW